MFIETEQETTQAVATEDNSSPSETTETQTEETQAEDTGEQEETGEQTETVATDEETETTETETSKEETTGKTAEQKRENETQYWKRQAEKREKELLEAKQQLGAEEKQKQEVYQQKQQQIDNLYAQAAEYQQAGDFQAAMQLTRQAATAEAEMRVNQRLAPLQQTYYKTQYEGIKRELAKDEDIINFADIETELDGIARAFEISQPIALTSKEAIKNWALIVQGKRVKGMLKAQKEESLKRTQANKKIIGEATIPSSKSAGAGVPGGYTQADKDYAAKHDIPLEKAREWRVSKERKQKTK